MSGMIVLKNHYENGHERFFSSWAYIFFWGGEKILDFLSSLCDVEHSKNLQQKKTECRLHSFLAECFLDLHETDSRVFWHSEISVEKTAKLDSGIKPESSMKSKPGDEV